MAAIDEGPWDKYNPRLTREKDEINHDEIASGTHYIKPVTEDVWYTAFWSTHDQRWVLLSGNDSGLRIVVPENVQEYGGPVPTYEDFLEMQENHEEHLAVVDEHNEEILAAAHDY